MNPHERRLIEEYCGSEALLVKLISEYNEDQRRRMGSTVVSEDKEKIEKASKILEKYDVGKNLTYFVDSYHHPNVGGIEWTKDFKPEVPKLRRASRFTFRGKSFELLSVNDRYSYDDSRHADFTLSVDGEVVLTSTMITARDEMFSYRSVSISHNHLKQVKIGEWMEDLQEVKRLTHEENERQRIKREADNLAATASKIDFGKYGDI